MLFVGGGEVRLLDAWQGHMLLVTLDDVRFIKHADYRPWGCHMCKFHAHIITRNRFPSSASYDAHRVFVKTGVDQFLYWYVQRRFFTGFNVTPPTKLLVDANRTRLDSFRRFAPSDRIPRSKVLRWRNTPLVALHASVTPLFAPDHLNRHRRIGRRLYDGAGDCSRFLQRADKYDLFQVVFLDYLFGCRDRIANCFVVDGAHVILDTGFDAKPMPKAVNFGSVADYLEYHAASNVLCEFRSRYPTWYAQLGVLSRRPGWMSPLRDLVGYSQWSAFEAHEGVVHARARALYHNLQHC